MGIPAFYRWLVEKYPRTVVEANEERPAMVNGVEVPVNTFLPNPNGVEFDNLYLDMNGIIHPCFHPEGLPAPSSYDEVFASIFKYIDKIFSIVRPRKLLFLSIDGVAPRAKMNQQRSRRFRAAKDAAEQASLSNGCESVLEYAEEKSASPEELRKMDSNVITPGTEFMDLLSSSLRYYISLRLNGDPGWQGIKVIFSDAKVPGEGEHKIMSYIRLQRNLPGFDPNTRHCLYGLDADLIMLALAAHEIQFSILREDVRKQGRKDGSRKRDESRARKKKHQDSKDVTEVGGTLDGYIFSLNFQFFNIAILREYLAYDMRIPGLTSRPDVERMIDDFVFMCVFVGNDFLPHIPSLEISEGAIDLLMMVYKQEFIQMGGYLTNSFEINLTRVEHFIQALGSHECGIFRRRKQVQNEKERYFQQFSKGNCVSNTSKTPLPCGTGSNSSHDPGAQTSIDSGSNAVVDKINLGEEGWKERFYAEKFEAKSEDERMGIKRHAVFKYIEGICWVMRYYYDGLCSWQWFYPYHYAPFASDFNGLDQLKINFVLGEPFKPFDQLMGVLPAASAHALPLNYRKLMTDASSPILDFYPTDFELDMNGKRFSWQAINKLPFIDESRLLSEIAKVEHTLTDGERERNSLGSDILSIHILHPLAATIIPFYQSNEHYKTPEAAIKLEIDPKISGGMNGYVYVSGKLEVPVKVCSPISNMEMIENSKVISVFYQCPSFHSHIPRLPDGVIMPRKTVKKKDISQSRVLWHETATFGRVLLKRSIPNSISGPHLAKLAYQLVSKHCVDDKFSKTRDITSNERAVGGGEEMKTGIKFNNRKSCSAVADGKGIATGANSRKRERMPKIHSQSEGDGGHSKYDEQLDSCNHANSFQNSTLREQKNGHADEVVEVKTEVISRKKKRTGPDATVLSMTAPDCVLKKTPLKPEPGVLNIVEKFDNAGPAKQGDVVQSGNLGKQGESDSQHVVGLDLMEPKKKKRRPKERRRGEIGGDPISNNTPEKSDHVPNNIPQKSDALVSSKQLKQRDGDDFAGEGKKRTGPDAAVLSTTAPNCVLKKTPIKPEAGVLNIVEKFDIAGPAKQGDVVQSGNLGKQGESDSQHVVGLDLMEPKKEKRRPKKRRRGEIGGDPISNDTPEKSDHVRNNIPQKSDGLVSSKQLKQRDGNDFAGEGKKRTGPDGVVLSTTAPDCVLKKTPIKPESGVLNTVEKFDNAVPAKQGDVVQSGNLGKQGESDGQHVVGLDLMEPKKEKRRPKKRRRGEIGGDPISNDTPEKSDHVPNNIPQKSDGLVSSKQLKQRDGNDFAGEGKKRTGPDGVVLSTTAPDCVLKKTPIKPESGVLNTVEKFDNAVPAKQGDVVQSGNLGKQGESDGQHVMGLDLMEPKKEKRRPKKRRRGEIGGDPISNNTPEKSDHVPNNIPQKSDGLVSSKQLKQRDGNDFAGEGKKRTGPDGVVLSTTAPDCVLKKTPIKPESGVLNTVEKFDNAVPAKQGDVVQSGNLGKQGESDGQHVVGLDLMEPKKEKRRPKKRRRGEIGGDPISNNTPEKSDHVPNNIPQKSDGLVSSKQLKQRDGNDFAGEGKKRTGPDGVVLSTTAPDCVLKKTPIKPESGVLNTVEKFDNAVPAKQGDVVQSGNLGKQGESDGQHVVGLDLMEPKKEKRRPKKRRRGEIGGDPISNNTPEKSDHVPNNIPQKSDGLVSSKQLKQRDGNDFAGEGKKRTGPDGVVLSTTAPDCVLKKTPIKPESGVLNTVEKFDNAVPAKQGDVVQSGNLGKQGESDGQHVVGLDLMEPKKEKRRPKKRRRGEILGDPISNYIPEKSDHVPNNIPQKSDGLVSSKQLKQREGDDYAGEGVVESGILMKQGESDSQHVVGLDLMEPKKKKRRSKERRRGEIGGDPISNNTPEKSDHAEQHSSEVR